MKFEFTCAGGPLDGFIKTGFANPNPKVWPRSKDGIDVDKILAAEFLLVKTYRRIGKNQIAGQGRYKITKTETRYAAEWVPSDDDIYFPVAEPSPSDG